MPFLTRGASRSGALESAERYRLTGEPNVRMWELKESMRLCLVTGTVCAGLALAPAAMATITVYTDTNVGGWVEGQRDPAIPECRGGTADYASDF